jgi:hypothetical protein
MNDKGLMEVERRTSDFLANDLPTVIEKAADKSADEVLKELRQKRPEVGTWEEANVTQFRFNLEARWGTALDLLRMLLHIAREEGAENLKRVRKLKRYPLKRDLLVRLHARACQVTDEIITLIENGFADGAMARWAKRRLRTTDSRSLASKIDGVAARLSTW